MNKDSNNSNNAENADELRVILEIGPKGKKVVATAVDWPGLERGAKTAEAAVERMRSYVPRYAPVAEAAGMGAEFVKNSGVDVGVIEQYAGTGSTDFWGISFAFSEIDQQPLSDEELERELKLMRSCWSFFDDVRRKVSAEMQKGPRGGGRDRDRIVRHTLFAELDFTQKVGVNTPTEVLLTEDGLKAHREAYCQAIREFHSEGKMARKWPLRYLIRHTAFHTLDHA